MPYKDLTGNLFASKAQALVNTVNCVGFMGKGVALEFRRRFPAMFLEYQKICMERRLRPGQILPYRSSTPWVINFAIKDDWKHPSKPEWVELCLEKFCLRYRDLGIKSVAFPWMGAMNGRIALSSIQEITRRYLSKLEDIDIEIYSFDSSAPDPLFDTLKERINRLSIDIFSHESGLQRRYAKIVYELVGNNAVKSIAEIVATERLGDTSLDKLYAYLVSSRAPFSPSAASLELF